MQIMLLKRQNLKKKKPESTESGVEKGEQRSSKNGKKRTKKTSRSKPLEEFREEKMRLRSKDYVISRATEYSSYFRKSRSSFAEGIPKFR